MPRTDYATGPKPIPLPCLSEPSRRQRAMWGIAVTGALVFLGALAIRLASNVELLQWWVPVALVIGVALADLASGLVQWSADTWGRADLPIISPRVLVPFRVHHVNPDDFLRRTFLDTNGDVAALGVLSPRSMSD